MKKPSADGRNSWKYAFLLLLFLNFIFFAWLFSALFSSPVPIDYETSDQASDKDSFVRAELVLKSKDVERLLQEYLIEKEQGVLGRITLEENVLWTGALEVLNFPISYSLEAEPFADENGDLQLKVKKVTLGKLSLPISSVLQLVKAQIGSEVPVSVGNNGNTLTIHISRIKEKSLEQLKLIKIDKEKQEYTFEITLSTENLLQ